MNTGDETGEQQPPAPFSEAELAEVATPPKDAELDDVEPAQIDAAPEAVDPEKLEQKGRRMDPDRARRVVESLLFVSDRPLSVDQLQQTTGIRREVVEQALALARDVHAEGKSGIVLHEVGGGWQFRTDADSSDYVRRFLQVKPQRLTRAALETLAIIAYRQPVTRAEVEDIRGVDSGAVVKALLERKLVKILGKKDEIGRPMIYGTTHEFLEFFALRDLASLPTLREFQELSREHQEIVERETPAEAPPEPLTALADPTFQGKLEETQADAEAALAELEDAISVAERRAKDSAAGLEKPAEKPLE